MRACRRLRRRHDAFEEAQAPIREERAEVRHQRHLAKRNATLKAIAERMARVEQYPSAQGAEQLARILETRKLDDDRQVKLANTLLRLADQSIY